VKAIFGKRDFDIFNILGNALLSALDLSGTLASHLEEGGGASKIPPEDLNSATQLSSSVKQGLR
jgi:hypothetical protein